MSRGKRTLLVTTTLLLAATGLYAGLWRSKKSQPAAEIAPAAAVMSLTAVEADSSRVLLHTNGTPVYTSYSPSPDVFVIDLTGTTRPADLTIPATLPAPVSSLTAEEAVEMGSKLTRVTFRLTQPVMPQASVSEKSVVVTVPASGGQAPSPVLEAPAAAATTGEAPVLHTEVNEPVVTAEALPLPNAKSVRKVATAGQGAALEVEITGDGAINSYKAFRLNAPERLVIDIKGVKSRVAKTAVEVNDGALKRVRVAQFAP
ncbi:MAG TPA: AMIN domain-containing protein, partial [Thermoanaerobaculia bacterium]|nr:AMIN domain-containing protein [Thermoanaerobaculia bacterium]